MKQTSFAAASLRVFDISLGQLLWSRRTVFMALAVGAPVLIALVLRIIDAMGVSVLRVNGVRVSGSVISTPFLHPSSRARSASRSLRG